MTQPCEKTYDLCDLHATFAALSVGIDAVNVVGKADCVVCTTGDETVTRELYIP